MRNTCELLWSKRFRFAKPMDSRHRCLTLWRHGPSLTRLWQNRTRSSGKRSKTSRMPLLHLLTLFSREKWMPFGHRWPELGKSARNTKGEIYRLAQEPDRPPNKRCN